MERVEQAVDPAASRLATPLGLGVQDLDEEEDRETGQAQEEASDSEEAARSFFFRAYRLTLMKS